MEKLISRIHAFHKQSDGFLAECHFHRAKLYELINAEAPSEGLMAQAVSALKMAVFHAQRRDPEMELEGQLESFDEINKMIARLQKKHSIATSQF